MPGGTMMNPRRYEITDFEWSIIGPLLPNKPRGVPRANDRKVRKRKPLAAYRRGERCGKSPVLDKVGLVSTID